jgi:hypothetical protein
VHHARAVRIAVGIVVLVAATVAAYGPALGAGWIWDDDAYLTGNALVRQPGDLGAIWLEPRASPQYYPMVFTSFWLEHRLWGLEPFGYHLVNVLLHAGGALLLWRVGVRLALPGAWLAAAVFALHPVHVESVAWVTERKNVLSTFLALGALLAWMRFRPVVAPDGETAAAAPPGRRWAFYALALVLFVAALLAKTVTASLPAVVCLLLWWKRRLRWADVLLLLPFLAAGLALGLATAWLEEHHVGSGLVDLGLTGPGRVVLAGRAAWFYLGKLAWPVGLVFIYPRWEIDPGQATAWLAPVAALAGLVALWAVRRRLGRGPLVAALVFGAVLAPALGFVDVLPMRYSWVADHFQYLASLAPICLAAAAAAGGRDALLRRAGDDARRRRVVRVAGVAAAVALLVTLGALTWRRAGVYHDAETLWRDTVARNPAASMARINLGNILAERGELDEAVAHYRAVIAADPPERSSWVLVRAHFNLGNQLFRQGRMSEALEAYGRATEVEPRYWRAHLGRGLALVELGDLDRAVVAFRRVLELDPDHARARQALDDAEARRRER